MGVGVGKNSIMEKNAKRKNTNGVKGHLNICRNVGGNAPHAPPPPPATSTAMLDPRVIRESPLNSVCQSLCPSVRLSFSENWFISFS